MLGPASRKSYGGQATARLLVNDWPCDDGEERLPSRVPTHCVRSMRRVPPALSLVEQGIGERRPDLPQACKDSPN
nr:hypothetical protein [Rhizobium laguerreae]